MLPAQLLRKILHFVWFKYRFIKLVKSTKFKHAALSRDCLSTGYPRQSDLNWSRHKSKRENMLRIYKYRKSCYREKSDTVVHTEKQQNGWHWLIVFEC